MFTPRLSQKIIQRMFLAGMITKAVLKIRENSSGKQLNERDEEESRSRKKTQIEQKYAVSNKMKTKTMMIDK